MPFVVVLYFDPAADEAIVALWQELEQAGFVTGRSAGGYRPHVSLGVTATAAQDALARRLAELAAGSPPLEVTLSSAGVFPAAESVAFLGVVATEELLSLHRAVHEFLAQETMGGSALYARGTWVPHCTAAFRVPRERIGEAVSICIRTPMPIKAQVSAMALVEVVEDGSREVARYPWGMALGGEQKA